MIWKLLSAFAAAVFALTVSAQSSPLPAASEFLSKEPVEKDWFPFNIDWKNQTPPVWDFSSLIETPSGKHGFVRVEGAHFVTGDKAVRLRLWGTNISGPACFPSKEDAPLIAAFLRRWGFNAVRFSHLDAPWANGLINYKNKEQISFNEDKFDSFFFFLSELRKNGIYYVIDGLHDFEFHINRFKYLNSFWKRGGNRFLLCFSTDMQRYHEDYLRKLLLSENPYTNCSLADDPALAGLQMLNETFLYRYVDKIRKTDDLPEELRADFQDKWTIWAGLNGQAAKFEDCEDISLRRRFFSWLERSYFQKQYAFLRDKIGLRCPIASTSCYVGAFTMPSAYDGDYSEGHAYYSHPSKEEILSPSGKITLTKLETDAPYIKNNYLKWLPFLLSQKIGYQPYLIGEWNNCLPERFDAPLMMASLGDIQDLDGAFLFTLAQSPWEKISERNSGSFISFGNPSIMINMIPAALAWHKGLIPAAKEEIAIRIPENFVYGVPEPSKKAEDSKFGKVLDAEGRSLGEKKEKYNYDSLAENAFLFRLYNIPETTGAKSTPPEMKSMTCNEKSSVVFPDLKKEALRKSPVKIGPAYVSVLTESWISVWGHFEKENISVGPLQISSETSQDFSVTIVSLDSKPIDESKRMLLALGPVSINNGAVFVEKIDSGTGKLLNRWEKSNPQKDPMYKAIQAKLKIRSGSGWRCFSLTSSGIKDKQVANRDKDISLDLNSESLFYLFER